MPSASEPESHAQPLGRGRVFHQASKTAEGPALEGRAAARRLSVPNKGASASSASGRRRKRRRWCCSRSVSKSPPGCQRGWLKPVAGMLTGVSAHCQAAAVSRPRNAANGRPTSAMTVSSRCPITLQMRSRGTEISLSTITFEIAR